MMRDCLAALIVMVLCSGCTADEAAAPEGANDPSTDRSTTPSATPAPSASQPSGRVRVDVTSQVSAGPETRAFAAYVRARTESFMAGSATPALRANTTTRELRRQQGLVTSAVDSGFTVPSQPRIALVERNRVTPRATVLGVCLYLPSMEYVDAVTGDSPYGAVPQRWQAAVVRLVGSHVTWKVDKVVPPPNTGGPSCRGLD